MRMNRGCHKLSENIWFVWYKRSYSGDKKGCHARGRTDEQRNVKIGLEFWKQNSQNVALVGKKPVGHVRPT